MSFQSRYWAHWNRPSQSCIRLRYSYNIQGLYCHVRVSSQIVCFSFMAVPWGGGLTFSLFKAQTLSTTKWMVIPLLLESGILFLVLRVYGIYLSLESSFFMECCTWTWPGHTYAHWEFPFQTRPSVELRPFWNYLATSEIFFFPYNPSRFDVFWRIDNWSGSC